MTRRIAAAAAALVAGAAALPAAAAAHGISQRADLPIPEWLFGWAAATVLVISFVALASLWTEPKLGDDRFRPVPGRLGAALTSPVVELGCGLVGVALLGLVVYAGIRGEQVATANLAPTFVYVVFWIGLVPISVLFGDIFKAFNPWRALGRAVALTASTAAGERLPAPLAYPAWLGRRPAALGVLIFAALELQVIPGGNEPHTLAVAVLAYSVLTFTAMALFGVDAWIERGETFSVYFGLFASLSIFERRDRAIGVRPPLSGLMGVERLPGTVLLLAAMIGTVSFDGASEAPLWTGISPDITDGFQSLGLSPQHALEATFGLGMLLSVALILGLYRLGVAGMRGVGGGFSAGRLAHAFVPSLVPIALAYVAAHYLTLLLYQGQAIIFLASDPLGDGSNLFGTASRSIDYGILGASATWYIQVAFVIAGHVAALTVAHDRALSLYDKPGRAARSQYWMLAVMVGFTSLALWLLSQANQ